MEHLCSICMSVFYYQVRAFPGRNVAIRVKARDLSGLPAAGILKFSSQVSYQIFLLVDYMYLFQDKFLGLDPSAVIVKPVDQSYSFLYEISTQMYHSFKTNFSIRPLIKLMSSVCGNYLCLLADLMCGCEGIIFQ